MSTILIIGNGPSVLNHEVGHLVDSYDHVVRFNNYQLKGYEKYIGTKTTILARRACDDVKLHPPELYEQIFCFVTYCKWTEGMIHVARSVKQFYGEKCTIVTWQECRKIGQKIGLDQPYNEWASIGVLMIEKALDIFGKDSITIHGFDGLNAGGQKEVLHYFNMPPKDARYHSGIKEQTYINSLNLRRLV